MPEESFDELEALRNAWSSLDGPAEGEAEGAEEARGPERDLAQPDEATRAMLEWTAGAWDRVESPLPELPLNLGRPKRSKRSGGEESRGPRLARWLVPLAAAAAVLALSRLLPPLVEDPATGLNEETFAVRDVTPEPSAVAPVGPIRTGTSGAETITEMNTEQAEPEGLEPVRMISVDSDRMEMVSGGVRLVLLTQN